MPEIRKGERVPWQSTSHDPNNKAIMKQVLYGSPEDTARGLSGRLAMINMASLEPSGIFSQHLHTGMDEFFTILEGSCKLKVDGIEYELGPGDLAVVFAKEIHSMINLSDKDQVIYQVFGLDNSGETKIIAEGY